METSVECTHCRVFMTSWSVPGSPVCYYQCPFCSRTFSSHYREVFRSRAGARMVERSTRSEPTVASSIPVPSPAEIRWAGVKARAARWFARLEQEEQQWAPSEEPGTREGIRREATSAPVPILSRAQGR